MGRRSNYVLLAISISLYLSALLQVFITFEKELFNFHMPFDGFQAHIERVMSDHFLFKRLTDSQFHVLLDCMQRVEVKAGDVVVEQVGLT